MSHTNHTTFYNLPQFIGSDKASWLGDLNPAFETIDANMHAIDTVANDADSKAMSAQSSANNAIELGHTAIANTSDLSEKLKIQKLDVEFTTPLKNNFTFHTDIMYNKLIGIVNIKGNIGFDQQIVPAGCVVGGLGSLFKSGFTTSLYSKCVIYFPDGTQVTKWLNISNNILTIEASSEKACNGISYDFVTMVDPLHFN